MLLDIWDFDVIHSIQGDLLDIELLLASYYSTHLLLITEFIDFEDDLNVIFHAVVVKFDFDKGCWLLIDSNQDTPLPLDDKKNVDEIVHKASVVRVLEWVMTQSSTNPF